MAIVHPTWSDGRKKICPFLKSYPLIVFGILVSSGDAIAQSKVTRTFGLTMQGPADTSGSTVIRDAIGRPCLDIEAAARPENIDPKMVDHVVSISNKCPRLIKVKVCYFGSDHCNELEIQAYKRADTIIGTMMGISFFRYSISQK